MALLALLITLLPPLLVPAAALLREANNVPNAHYARMAANKQQTSFTCSGYDKSADKSLFRTCFFTNVCVSKLEEEHIRDGKRLNGTWTAYRRALTPLLYDGKRGPIYQFKDAKPGFVYAGLSW